MLSITKCFGSVGLCPGEIGYGKAWGDLVGSLLAEGACVPDGLRYDCQRGALQPMRHLLPGRERGAVGLTWLLFLGAFLLYKPVVVVRAAADDEARKARVALSYIDCDGDFTIRNGRIGLNLGGRFVADTILGATYVGAIYVWGGEDKRYTLLFSDDLSTATLASTSGGSVQAKCHPAPHG